MTTIGLEHEAWCRPRPGADERRVESYPAPRYADDGTTIAIVQVVRCMECGRATYDGRAG